MAISSCLLLMPNKGRTRTRPLASQPAKRVEMALNFLPLFLVFPLARTCTGEIGASTICPFSLLLLLLDVLLINSIFQLRIVLFEVAHMCNSAARPDAYSGIDTTYPESSLRLFNPRKTV
jgi:hypothetical protein